MSRIILKTYSDFWQIETVIYHIEGVRMPFPMGARNAGYYIFGLVLAVVISNVPILNLITKLPLLNQPIIYYLGLPFVIMKLLSTIKIEGKHPYQFMKDMFVYTFFTPGHYEYMKPMKAQVKKRLKANSSFREVESKSVFEERSKGTYIEVLLETKEQKTDLSNS